MPPLHLQLQAWKSIDSSLDRIGLITSEAHAAVADEASEAAGDVRAELTHLVSTSDRETLYLFKRLAPQIDGLLLFPDSQILSPNVLRELLSYAVSHDVGVLVFNDSLLAWGALLSASSRTPNVAVTVAGVLDRVVAGRTEDLPTMTPLSEVAVSFNADVATQLGMNVVPRSSWVIREAD